MRLLLALFLLLPLSVFAAENQRACTQKWCVEGFSIDFLKQISVPGNYTFNIEVDGRQIICSGALPFQGCGEQHFNCNAEDVFIGESGCALPSSEHGLIGLTMRKIPKHISFSVTHAESGKSFSYAQYVKEECVFPNGKECDPRPCCQAMYRIPIVFN